jgi:hypothetical protein
VSDPAAEGQGERAEALRLDANLYAYAAGQSTASVDREGLDAIPVAFTEYAVETETLAGRQPLGHAGIVLVDADPTHGRAIDERYYKARTRYYEYGRYDEANQGITRRLRVPDVIIDRETGRPTDESMKNLLGALVRRQGEKAKGFVVGTYIKNDRFADMADFAERQLAESRNPNREPYSVTGKNCSTFCSDVLEAGGEPSIRSFLPGHFMDSAIQHYGNRVLLDRADANRPVFRKLEFWERRPDYTSRMRVFEPEWRRTLRPWYSK